MALVQVQDKPLVVEAGSLGAVDEVLVVADEVLVVADGVLVVAAEA